MDYSLVKLQRYFRIVELCILVVFLLWLATRVPFALRISGEYCRRFSTFIISPTSIFLLGNAIVIALLAKSGTFSSAGPSAVQSAVSEFCDELRSEFSGDIPTVTREEDEIVYQDKEIICEESTKQLAIPKEEISEVKASGYHQRSKSMTEKEVQRSEKLRRSETDIRRREDPPEDDEEFRRTIEAFIAKQVRFHREERLAVVLA